MKTANNKTSVAVNQCKKNPDQQTDAQNLKEPKETIKLTKNVLFLGLALVLLAGVLIGYFIKHPAPSENYSARIKKMNIDQQRTEWIAIGNNLKVELAKEGKYDCCITSPCNYCLYKEKECECRQDILSGKHPCGECIGEILEGKGLAELKPYYAKAIAHKVGAEHKQHLQEIIDSMYP